MESISNTQPGIELINKINPKLAIETHKALIDLSKNEVYEDFYKSIIYSPPQILKDDQGNMFLASNSYKVGNSYRSPFTNNYIPKSEENLKYPNQHFRDMEILFNTLLKLYVQFYYGEGISSAYFLENNNMTEGQVFISKTSKTSTNSKTSETSETSKASETSETSKISEISETIENASNIFNNWNSIHLFSAYKNDKNLAIRIYSSVFVNINISQEANENDLSLFYTIISNYDQPCDFNSIKSKVTIFGEVIETQEAKLRLEIENILIRKVFNIIDLNLNLNLNLNLKTNDKGKECLLPNKTKIKEELTKELLNAKAKLKNKSTAK